MEEDKTQTLRTVGGGALLVAAILTFGLWRSSVEPSPLGHVGILVDPSDSRPEVCDQVSVIVKKVMEDPELSRGTTITLFSTGSPESANEPVQHGTFHLPDTRSTMEGPESIVRKESEVVRGIEARCVQITQTKATPIFQGIKRVVGFLQQQDSRLDAKLKVYALTDGEETEVKEIKKAFDEPPGSAVEIPRIDNQRVAVVICGVAETIGTVQTSAGRETKTRTRDPRRADRAGEVWKNVFSQPTTVSISPYCLSSIVTKPRIEKPKSTTTEKEK
jgi:hypothetical protein